MAKTTDFLSQTSGKLTDQFVTRQTAHGTILARAPRKTATPRRSEKQANMRCQMANMSANFKLYQGKLKLAWEGKKAGLSEFNCFVASNYDKAPVYITKSMRVAGACVLAESYISSGSLPPIENVVSSEGVLVSDLRLGSLQIGAGTTVADLTIAILTNNEEWEDGDQLTWLTVVFLLRASAMLMRAWHCARLGVGSTACSGWTRQGLRGRACRQRRWCWTRRTRRCCMMWCRHAGSLRLMVKGSRFRVMCWA